MVMNSLGVNGDESPGARAFRLGEAILAQLERVEKAIRSPEEVTLRRRFTLPDGWAAEVPAGQTWTVEVLTTPAAGSLLVNGLVALIATGPETSSAPVVLPERTQVTWDTDPAAVAFLQVEVAYVKPPALPTTHEVLEEVDEAPQ
jgi:hypothetical protein